MIESIALRLDALPPACGKLARAIAVAGSGGTIAARLAGLDVRQAVEAAEALAHADLLRGDGFAHPLVQQAVYAAIPAAERAELHAAAARLVSGPERVAAHVMAAGPGGGVWAAHALRDGRATRPGRAARPTSPPASSSARPRRSSPRDELVPVLRELARALIATGGPEGLPCCARRSRWPATTAARSRSSSATRCSSRATSPTARRSSSRPAPQDELATVAVLDLALVRRFGGLDGLASRLPRRPERGRRLDRGRHAAARERAAPTRPRRRCRPPRRPRSPAC